MPLLWAFRIPPKLTHSMMNWLRTQLAKQVDGSSLGVFRILWGLLMIWESIRKLPKADGMYSPEYFHFKYEFFYFVEPLPEVWMMQAEITLMLIAAIFITAGHFFRPACALFLVIFSHLFLIEKIYYNNHFYLTILMSFLMIFSQADRCYRLPLPWRRKSASGETSQPQTVPLWNLVLLRSQIVILYFFGGVAKLNSDWLAGEPVRYWFSLKPADHPLSYFLGQEWFVWMVCWSGLILDLFAGFTLLSKRTRVFTMIVLVVFHATNSMIFQIGLFPIIGIGLLVLFIDPDRPRKIFGWLHEKIGLFNASAGRPVAVLPSGGSPLNWALTTFVIGWIAVQVILPLRIHKYKQNPGWTEVGQCFSWRMMLRTKDAFIHLKFDPPEAERFLEENPEILPRISKAHLTKMGKNPLFVMQYTHVLKEALQATEYKDVKISCVSIASLNGRPYQFLIDPQTDLTKVNYEVLDVPKWIVPLDKHRRPGQYPQNPAERKEVIAGVYKQYIIQNRPTPTEKAPVKYAAVPEYSGSVH